MNIMKKITSILFLFLFLAHGVIAQNGYMSRSRNVVENKKSDVTEQQKSVKLSSEWELDFETVNDFSLEFLPWTVIDGDLGQTYGIDGVSFPHKEEPMAFIAFNPATTTPSLSNDEAIQPYGGNRFGACFSSVPPNTNDDWLISPQLVLGANSSFSFYVKSYSGTYGLDKYSVAVSISGNETDDFSPISGVLDADTSGWQHEVFDISEYDGDTVYVAIHCVSDDTFILMVDDIKISSTLGIKQRRAISIKVFPNPVSESVFIESEHLITNIEIVDNTGRMLLSKNCNDRSTFFDISDLAKGIYIIKIFTEKGSAIRKIQKL